MCGLSSRVEALAFKVWRDYISNMIHSAPFKSSNNDNFHIIQIIRAKITHFEDEYPKLKEITTILELALWKISLNRNNYQKKLTRCQKKVKIEESDIRRKCRIICGADVVIEHVLSYLITADEDVDSDSESDSIASDDDSNNSE